MLPANQYPMWCLFHLGLQGSPAGMAGGFFSDTLAPANILLRSGHSTWLSHEALWACASALLHAATFSCCPVFMCMACHFKPAPGSGSGFQVGRGIAIAGGRSVSVSTAGVSWCLSKPGFPFQGHFYERPSFWHK